MNCSFCKEELNITHDYGTSINLAHSIDLSCPLSRIMASSDKQQLFLIEFYIDHHFLQVDISFSSVYIFPNIDVPISYFDNFDDFTFCDIEKYKQKLNMLLTFS